ncbi:hypothetical protein RUM43_007906 [Polyplax serrata]|uniref:Uncharacterized protein n=1 Tax=Polyplax serrata TaxID=468196 RepID=A0AAN8S222_POLSC
MKSQVNYYFTWSRCSWNHSKLGAQGMRKRGPNDQYKKTLRVFGYQFRSGFDAGTARTVLVLADSMELVSIFLSRVVLLLVAFVNCAVEKESEEIGDFWKAEHENEVIQFEGLVCPKEYHRLPIFAYKCNADEDCVEFGGVCCREKNWKICRQGVYKKKKEPKHARTSFPY